MKSSIVALFGEAEKGDLHTIYFCSSLGQLFDFFGHPPRDTLGLFYAIQALLYGKSLIYFRVQEEGLSDKDYLFGLHLLREYSSSIPKLNALFLPRVGTRTIIDEGLDLCQANQGILLMQEADFYDYLTDFRGGSNSEPPLKGRWPLAA